MSSWHFVLGLGLEVLTHPYLRGGILVLLGCFSSFFGGTFVVKKPPVAPLSFVVGVILALLGARVGFGLGLLVSLLCVLGVMPSFVFGIAARKRFSVMSAISIRRVPEAAGAD